ncbi:MAG TPA: hypothetical protein VKR43_06530 [Bryobacteraceae bacterium]|nr:hypothetical protein [Bryobacteraceae bacterium]
MNTPDLEKFLARLYIDPETRRRFLDSPYEEAARFGLTDAQCRALEQVDRVGLEMAAHSLSIKRSRKR